MNFFLLTSALSVWLNMVSVTLTLSLWTITVYPIIFGLIWMIVKKFIYEEFFNPTIDLSANNLSKKLVVITGCDSGFGHQTAIKLYKMGFSVLATCLTEQGKKDLIKQTEKLCIDEHNSFHCVLVDVTNDDDVIGMKSYLIQKCLSKPLSLNLWSVINNAGIMKTAEFDLLTVDDYKQVMDVNLFGSIRIIKALIHLLRTNRNSRIINIVSSGILNPMYAYSAYLCSKSSLESLTKVLRAEMKPFGCYVSSILPGANNTNILNTKLNMEFYQNKINNLDKEILNDYGSTYFEQSAKKCIMGVKFVTPNSLDKVVNNIIDAVIREKPYKQYIVGYDANFQYFLSYFPLAVQEFIISEPLRPWIKPQMMKQFAVKSHSHF